MLHFIDKVLLIDLCSILQDPKVQSYQQIKVNIYCICIYCLERIAPERALVYIKLMISLFYRYIVNVLIMCFYE